MDGERLSTDRAVTDAAIMLLEAVGISKRFGGLQALDKVSLSARSGAVTAIIGPNGAGKSTLLDCLSGITAFDEGAVFLDGKRHGRLDRTKMVALGITRTFQNIRVFERLTVEEHVALARSTYRATDRAPRRREDRKYIVQELLDFVGLADKRRYHPSQLSYGERRLLEIARGLAIEPRAMLLDEPAAGSTLSEHVRLAALISAIARRGVALLLVEHHMNLVAEVSSDVVVLTFGCVLTTGSLAEIQRNPIVISAYLGVAA
jgi:ABC-type branched-subunit amino acid transport system ATPase component